MQESKCEPAEFRSTCSRFVTGVTIVTSVKEDGAPVGLTVSSFTSVSLDPPLVLICIHEHSRVLDELLRTGSFGLNILAADQEELSARFAGRSPDRFDGLNWRLSTLGVPLLAGVLATLECSVERTVACGDHQILIGLVRAVSRREGVPLIRFSSAYCSIATAKPEISLQVAAS